MIFCFCHFTQSLFFRPLLFQNIDFIQFEPVLIILEENYSLRANLFQFLFLVEAS